MSPGGSTNHFIIRLDSELNYCGDLEPKQSHPLSENISGDPNLVFGSLALVVTEPTLVSITLFRLKLKITLLEYQSSRVRAVASTQLFHCF